MFTGDVIPMRVSTTDIPDKFSSPVEYPRHSLVNYDACKITKQIRQSEREQVKLSTAQTNKGPRSGAAATGKCSSTIS